MLFFQSWTPRLVDFYDNNNEFEEDFKTSQSSDSMFKFQQKYQITVSMLCLHLDEITSSSLRWYTARSFCPPFLKVRPYFKSNSFWCTNDAEMKSKCCWILICVNTYFNHLCLNKDQLFETSNLGIQRLLLSSIINFGWKFIL